MEHFCIQLISEGEIDGVIVSAGGDRAHKNADRRDKRGADYILGDAVIELKILEENGLKKQERQARLASLFRSHCSPSRPVVVLDPNALPETARREFDRAMEGPVKNAVRSAKHQLRQSRTEFPSSSMSVLWIVNNGYTALDNESLTKLIVHRVTNDTSNIDGVIVSGCYFYSDTFDSFFLWPINYIPIRLDRPLAPFERLKAGWDALATKRMTALIQGQQDSDSTKGPVIDTEFDVDGVTYVKPAPPIGSKSKFFRNGRPRKNSTGLSRCPPVATIFAELSYEQWERFRQGLAYPPWLGNSFNEWQQQRARAERICELKPLVLVPITFDDWTIWAQEQPEGMDAPIHHYAHTLFEKRIQILLQTSRERTKASVLPSRYILVITEEIGQDRANDVSHIMEICEFSSGKQQVSEIVADQRMFHEHAVAVGCAHALARRIDVVMWQKDLRYAWI
ncbi:MAG: hypothetical protein FD157_2601 [Rhodocyclaceae bacterium]|nr:MAG: hypothetical protein FD157_2601 [Rhodocyclaceae bacterium]TND02032.1 MAG: hypothetical protein FD118_2062 [Rhodocyclaceae bacterium]